MPTRLLLILFCGLLSLPLPAAVRVALIALDEAGRAQADLALAELSQDSGLVFLERAELAKIEKELRLSSIGDLTIDPHLLQNTQLFLIVQKDRLIAFDGATGVRLKDCDTDKRLAAAIRAAVAKQRDFAAGASRRISAMPLVPVNLSEAQEKFARHAETRLLRHLCNRPGLVLLERRHLLHLLNEPNAATSDLTGKLFAGALVLRPTARANGKEVLLHLQFYSPDGKRLLAETQTALTDDKALDRFLAALRLPDATAEDKRGEARNFIYEAWFAVSHGLPSDAIASGASAVALDREYREELSRIAFLAASRLLGSSYYRHNDANWDLALADLRLALRLTEELGGYTRDSRFFAARALQSVFPHTFQPLDAARQQTLRELAGQLILLRMRQLDREVLPLADRNAPRWPDAIFCLEARYNYVTGLDRFCNLSWDYRWWRELVYPALLKLLEDFQDLRPELERFASLSSGERIRIVSRPDLKRQRLPMNRQKAYLELQNGISFFHFNPRTITPDERAFFQDAFRRMADSPFIPIALSGLDGLMRLRTGLDQRPRDMATTHRKDLRFLYAQLLRIYRTGFHPDPNATTLWTFGDDPEFLPQKLELMDLAVHRFRQPRIAGDMLLRGHERWDADTARRVYDRLAAWRRETAETTPADKIAANHQKSQLEDLRRYQRPLEKRFGFVPADVARLPVASPFGQCWTPFPGQRNVNVVGHEGTRLYVQTHEKGHTILWRIDTAVSMTPVEVRRIPPRGADINARFGTILDRTFTASDGRTLQLFPRDGAPPERLDLSSLGIHDYRWMTGAGDRLFFVCGGYSHKGSAILELHLPTRRVRTIASTIDRTVAWPLQGINRPYEFYQLRCDAPRHRLLMLLNEAPPPEGRATYNVRLFAYDWERQSWSALSRLLPIHAPSPVNRFVLHDGAFWLAIDDGFGPINANGDWQPLFLLDFAGHPVTRPPNRLSDSWKKVVFDLSRLRPPPPGADDLQSFDLHLAAFNGDYYFGRRAYFVPATGAFYRYADDFTVAGCLGDRYCHGQTANGEWQIRECLPTR